MVKETLMNGLLKDTILTIVIFIIIGAILFTIFYIFFRLTLYRFVIKPAYQYAVTYFNSLNAGNFNNSNISKK